MRVNLQLAEIVRMVEGTTTLDHSFLVKSLASLDSAGPEDLAVIIDRGDASVFDAVAREKIEKCQAGLILSAQPVVEGKNYLLVSDPLKAYQTITSLLFSKGRQESMDPKYPHAFVSTTSKIGNNVTIASGAVVQAGAKIGDDSSIGAHASVGRDAVIGAGVMIHEGARIRERCTVGDATTIQSNAVIGSDGFGFQVSKTGMNKIPHIGNVTIGAHAEIGANCSIDRAVFNETAIGNGVKLDNNVHIAHGVVVGDHTAILALTCVGGSAKIGVGCQIGGHVAIKDHVTIGNGVKIVSKSAVVKDIAAGKVVGGIPSTDFNEWKRIVVATLKLPDLMKKAKTIEAALHQKQSQGLWQRLFGSKK